MSMASSNSLDSLRPRSRLREVLRWATMPGIAGLLLLGVWAHQSSYENPNVFDEYHSRCRSAIEQLPTQVGHWMGREVPLPQPALDLLDPNAQRNIRFTDFSPMGLTGPDRRISVMIVQCKLARDMQGHYPPRCYPAQGARLAAGPVLKPDGVQDSWLYTAFSNSKNSDRDFLSANGRIWVAVE